MKTEIAKELNKEICKRFLQLRKKYGYKQDQVSDILKISRTAVVNIESNRQHVTIVHLLILSNVYGCDVKDFLPDVKLVEVEIRLKSFSLELPKKKDCLGQIIE